MTQQNESKPKPAGHRADPAMFSAGGLRGRFKQGNKPLWVGYDPFDDVEVRFRSEVCLSNWLLRRFDSDVTRIDHAPQALSALHHGKLVTCTPSLVLWWRAETPSFEVVVPRSSKRTIRDFVDLEVVAHAHGARPSIRIARDIDEVPELIPRFHRHLQLVIQHLEVATAARVDDMISCFLQGRPRASRAAIVRELKSLRWPDEQLQQCVDAMLLFWRARGRIDMDIHSGDLDEHTDVFPNF